MNIIIGIPAHNEENNIGKLLHDILYQKSYIEANGNTLSKILIISDDSSDKTDDIVLSFSKKNEIIEIIRRSNRLGKASALNMIFNKSEKFDILILLDADVRLGKYSIKYLIDIILKNPEIGMVGGNPIPIYSNSFNFAEGASFFSWALLDAIKKTSKENLYHSHGRILALTKKFYSGIVIPITSTGDDQYLYLSCIKKGMKFIYVHNAIVMFRLPRKVNDHLMQSIRFSNSLKQNESIFGKKLINENMKIENKFTIIKTFVRYPRNGTFWFLLYILGKLIYKKGNNPPIFWEISKTTK